jgi:hypothetical protein
MFVSFFLPATKALRKNNKILGVFVANIFGSLQAAGSPSRRPARPAWDLR